MNFFYNAWPIHKSPLPFFQGHPGFFRNRRMVPDRVLEKIADLNRQAVQGDKQAVTEAYQLLELTRQIFPRHNLVEAYYGSILTLQGRDALDPMERLEKVRYGLTFLDEAVSTEPDQIQIRVLRGYVCSRLPEVFFRRTATGIEDFAYLVARYEKEPGVFSESFYRQILADLAAAYQNLGQIDKASEIQKKLAQTGPSLPTKPVKPKNSKKEEGVADEFPF